MYLKCSVKKVVVMIRYLAQISVLVTLFGMAIFISSGNITWFYGWLLMAVLILGQVLTAVIIRKNPALIIVIAIVIRTENEDEFLRRGLDGYQTYTRRVKYCLIPMIW